MDYQQTIDYLMKRLPMFSRIGPPAFKHDLVNIRQLCEALGNPQQRFKSIHVAGTNGKGSVSHMLAAIHQVAGYRTGLYTSPHLRDFRERIRVNGDMIREEFVTEFTGKIQPLIEQIDPSFFEISVAMAFDYFVEQQVDIAVIETGLGGRFDSTNIITPVLSVITNIGMDHMNMLGDTLEKIAFEKAGIIKPGIPVVIGEVLPETQEVFERVAAEKESPISIATKKRMVAGWNWEKYHLVIDVEEEHHVDHKTYTLDLPGIYQTKNLLTVLEACHILRETGWDISEEHIREGLEQTKKLTGLHGRWEIIHTGPLVVIDVAHNPDGIAQLVQQAEVTEHRELHIVLGLVRDKDVDKMLALLPKQARYYFSRANIPRALPEDELAVLAAIAKLQGTTWSDVNDAIKAALDEAHPDDLVIICGSIFLAGEVNMSIHSAAPKHTGYR